MKTPRSFLINKVSVFTALAVAAIGLSVTPAHATNFSGNGNTDFGGDIGNGVMTLTDDGTNINGSLVVGHANNMYNTLVIYIDTGASGGFTSTTNFNDQNDALRVGISGVQNGNGRSAMSFTNGFTPKYAIALGPNTASFGGLWQLAAGNNNSLIYIQSANLNPSSGSSGPFTFSIQATNLGLTLGSQATIKIFGTYISNSGYRSGEAIGGNDTGSAGWFPFLQTAYATYKFASPAAPTYPVKFQVDMSNEVALGNFNPGGGDTVYCGGSFQTNPFAVLSFPLTNNPSAANTNIYSGTYLDANPTNTSEQFKFAFNSVVSNSLVYDDDLNRVFTLKSGGQVLPLVYFNDVFPSPSVTTNYLTVSIDMGPQIFLGNFNPTAGLQVEALGTFESPKWTAGFILTNNPTAAGNASNIYSGTIADGNYPGSFEQFKFVINNGGTLNYESGGNRTFYTPTNSGALPLAYFNGVSSYASTPVTFSVDMSVPILEGMFIPGNGDTAGCAGTFQTNSFGVGATGFILTNNPTGSNPNIYSGTYIDHNQPGVGEQYKFVINTNGGGTAYELFGQGNRTFVLNAAGVTNALVFWNNQSTNSITLVSTVVTFTVDMNNAVDEYGNPFDSANDIVMVDGNFTYPQWQVINNATDPMISSDYYAYVLTNNPVGSTLYSGQFTVAAGNSLQVLYKYGIYHNTSQLNTNVDNEAGPVNHTRYIRSSGGTYNFPTDIFGEQRINLAAATEPVFGNLAISRVSGGQLPITWLGGVYGVHLQTSTNLMSSWLDVAGTTGLNSTNWPTSKGSRYFRLVKP